MANEKNLQEKGVPTDSAHNNYSAAPVETGNNHANRTADKTDSKDPMPTLDTTNTPSSRYEVINYVANYLAGINNENAMEFYNRIKTAIDAKAMSGPTSIGTKAGASIVARGLAKEELELVFASDESLSEDFKTKAATLFEVALNTAIAAETTRLQEENDAKLEEVTESVKTELMDRVGNFIEYVAESWIEKNEPVVNSNLKVEAVDSFLEGMKSLFAEHYVSVPEDKVDVVESLTTEVSALEAKLNEETAKNIELADKLRKLDAKAVLESTLEGLTDTQKDKVRTMAEAVGFTTVEQYQTKLTTIKEAVAPKGNTKPLNEDTTVDRVEPTTTIVENVNPQVAAAAAAMKRLRAR
jgi:hypothetical protein